MPPFLTGGTVIALIYGDGALIAADTMLNYGSTRRIDNYKRIISVGEYTLIGFTGDEADFKDCIHSIELMHRDARCYGVPFPTTEELHGFLSTRNYSSRSEMNPIYNGYLVVGKQTDEKPFVGVVDMQGSRFTANFFATGLGKHFVLPVLREGWKPGLSREDALRLLQTSLRILALNDANAGTSYIVGEATAQGTRISPIQSLELDWTISGYKDNVALEIAQGLAALPDTELAAVLHYLAEIRGPAFLMNVLQTVARLDEPRDEALAIAAQDDIKAVLSRAGGSCLLT